MKSKTLHWNSARLLLLTFLLFAASSVVLAQTPVDENGEPLGPVYSDADGDDVAVTDIPLLTASELATLIGPVALYPDDLLAVVLPASTYPLEVVQAARYLEQLETDSSLQPDDEWDDSVVALLNYPEVLTMMSEDIDWTWRLGEAVIAQQSDVVAAVETFRDRAYGAGNLKSDERQTVSRNEADVIEIKPVADDVIYVPYYEPERVVVYQTRPVYHYYPRAYPVYYYPYPAGYYFADNFFWGVTTAFRIGWFNDHLHVYHHSYRGHPYYGWNYYGSYWRRPSIQIFNTWYGGHGYANVNDRYRYGSFWRPRRHGGARPGYHSNRDRYYSDRRRSSSVDHYANRDRRDQRDNRRRGNSTNGASALVPRSNDAARSRATTPRSSGAAARAVSRRNDGVSSDESRRNIRFRNRNSSADGLNARRSDADATRNGNQRRAAVTPNRSQIAGARVTDSRRRAEAANTRRRADTTQRATEARSNPQPRLANGAAAQRRSAPARPRVSDAPRRTETQRTRNASSPRRAPPAAARPSAPRPSANRPAAQRSGALRSVPAAEPARRNSRSSNNSRRRD